MPWYDVRYVEYRRDDYPVPEISLVREWRRMLADTMEEALELFAREHGHLTLRVVTPKYEWDTRDRSYWYDKWRMAMAAMPVKVQQHKHREWVKRAKGSTPLPEFIKGSAKGEMIIKDGYVLVEHVTYTSHEYGRAAALGILLGYITWTGNDHKRKRANSYAMLGRKIPESSRPRDPKMRKLLAQLGTMDKDEIKAMLAKMRKQMNQ